MVWDIIPDEQVADFMPLVNLVPGSEEGNEVEDQASKIRYKAIMPVYRELQIAAQTAGLVMGRAIVERYCEELDAEEKAEKIQETMQISQALCQATIANLVDSGYLHLPHRAVLTRG